MKNYIKHDPWKIIEEGFDPKLNKISESIFSIGNGKMGHRANFEETYSGDSLRGNYISGIYYPDKTRVGWWKNGYPEYFAKVLNAPAWTGIKIKINATEFDLHYCKVTHFTRELNMLEGYLFRSFTAELPDGKIIKISATRILSIVNDELGVIKYSITPVNFSETVQITLDVDADIVNQDSNYNEKFWDEINKSASLNNPVYVTAVTRKTGFQVCTAIDYVFTHNGTVINPQVIAVTEKEKYAARIFDVALEQNSETIIYKYASVTTSMYFNPESLIENAFKILKNALNKGFDTIKLEQKQAWEQKWIESDIIIEGDIAAQQGIRFNIFQLNQTYTGTDERLNIGPKGFTGEKYGGSTYWDTEAYCIPFYLSTADQNIARNLLIYRYKHLQKAIENAQKLGFTNGAALYPMVTMNGEECHNEWEITFEEIHRNGAIAFAIYNYVRYTGDKNYLAAYGLEVLIAISRFWAQRVHFSELKQQYVMHGVTGPNEYENNVNNNWYTNKMAIWTLKYTLESLQHVEEHHHTDYLRITEKSNFKASAETLKWSDIIDRMYFPTDTKRNIFVQHDGFLDKELIPVADLNPSEKPLNQKWSWDRILRSCYIKQADVLQGIYFLEDEFDTDSIKRNFDFYEPFTVHESSLSSCVHSILAAKIKHFDKAYNFYLNASRLDLDDYNNDTEDGLHITSMGGTWMTIIQGFGGMRIKNGHLSFEPFIPAKWNKYAFKIKHQNNLFLISVDSEYTTIENVSGNATTIFLNGNKLHINENAKVQVQSFVVN